METDLLFTFAFKSEWKEYSSSGYVTPKSLDQQGYIKCYHGHQAEVASNNLNSSENEIFLIVIDPLRVHVPIKKNRIGDELYPHLYGSISIDAVIDRILLKKDKKGRFFINIKHFD